MTGPDMPEASSDGADARPSAAAGRPRTRPVRRPVQPRPVTAPVDQPSPQPMRAPANPQGPAAAGAAAPPRRPHPSVRPASSGAPEPVADSRPPMRPAPPQVGGPATAPQRGAVVPPVQPSAGAPQNGPGAPGAEQRRPVAPGAVTPSGPATAATMRPQPDPTGVHHEGVDLATIPGFFRRGLASLIDEVLLYSLAVACAFAGVRLALGATTFNQIQARELPWENVQDAWVKLFFGAGTGIAVGFALWILFTAFMVGQWGASIGKFITGIRVRRADGYSPVSFGQALVRSFLLRGIEGIFTSIALIGAPFAWIFGLSVLLGGPQRRGWADTLTKTIVVLKN